MRFYIHIFFLYLFLFKKNQRLLYCQPMCVCLILSNSWMLLHSEESTVNFSYQSLWISCLGLTQFEATAEKDSVVLVVQSCPTVCDPMDCSLPGSSLHGILQVRILEWKKKKRILEWIAIPFSRGSSWPRDWTQVSCVAGSLFTVWATGKTTAKKDSTVNILIRKPLHSSLCEYRQ